jgi:hypothetical protein
MYNDSNTVAFENVDQFNDLLSHIKEDCYSEFVKISKYFIEYTKTNGANNFNTLMVVFNRAKQTVGIVSCKGVEGKEELYKSLAQMLFFPASINSSLFILAQDAKISTFQKNNFDQEPPKIDALVITYVTKSKCVVFTVPYTVNDQNDVTFDYDKAYLNTIASSDGTTKDVPRGDMIELFFIFSHMDTSGPFSFHEVLSFLKNKGFEFQIIDQSALEEKHIGIPVIVQG